MSPPSALHSLSSTPSAPCPGLSSLPHALHSPVLPLHLLPHPTSPCPAPSAPLPALSTSRHPSLLTPLAPPRLPRLHPHPSSPLPTNSASPPPPSLPSRPLYPCLCPPSTHLTAPSAHAHPLCPTNSPHFPHSPPMSHPHHPPPPPTPCLLIRLLHLSTRFPSLASTHSALPSAPHLTPAPHCPLLNPPPPTPPLHSSNPFKFNQGHKGHNGITRE